MESEYKKPGSIRTSLLLEEGSVEIRFVKNQFIIAIKYTLSIHCNDYKIRRPAATHEARVVSVERPSSMLYHFFTVSILFHLHFRLAYETAKYCAFFIS